VPSIVATVQIIALLHAVEARRQCQIGTEIVLPANVPQVRSIEAPSDPIGDALFWAVGEHERALVEKILVRRIGIPGRPQSDVDAARNARFAAAQRGRDAFARGRRRRRSTWAPGRRERRGR